MKKQEKEMVRENVPRIPITKIPLLDRLCLLGPPGVGKTEVVKRLAEEEAQRKGKVFVDVRSAPEDVVKDVIENPGKYYLFMRVIAPQVTPEDLGVPAPTENYVTFRLLKYFYLFTLPGVEGVLFIDELNNVQRDDVLTMFFALIQEHELGYNSQLSPGVKVVVAGNETQWSDVARPLPWPLLNRMTVLYVSPGSVDEWIEYMEKCAQKENRPWEKRIAGYLKIHPQHLLVPPPEGMENVNFPTPRAWTELAFLLPQFYSRKGKVDTALIEALCVGRLGPQMGLQLAAFLASYVDEKMLNDVLANPERFETLKTGERINLLYMLAQKSVKELKNQVPFLSYLRDKYNEYFMIFLLLIPRERRVEFIKETRDTLLKEYVDKMAPYLL